MGGGGLYLDGKVTVNIRECTFVQNEATTESSGDKHGHQIMTRETSSEIPSVTLVNTQFKDLAGSHPFYGCNGAANTHGAEIYISPTNCTSNPCSVPPFTGGCFPSASEKQGVFCDYDNSIACAVGSYTQSVSTANALPPAETACAASKPEWDCT